MATKREQSMYCLYRYVLIATASRMTMHASRKGCITSVFAMDRLVGMNTSELSANTATALYASVLRGFVPAAGNEDISPRSYRGIMIVCVLDSARWEEASDDARGCSLLGRCTVARAAPRANYKPGYRQRNERDTVGFECLWDAQSMHLPPPTSGIRRLA